jgi:hypothetical protein
MAKEVRLKHADIQDAQTMTPIVGRAISEAMGEARAMHRYEVAEMIDDPDRRERILKMQPKRTYVGFGKAG